MHLDVNARANVVPVDYCANMILATAWQTAEKNIQRLTDKLLLKEPTIYNYVPTEQNPINWNQFITTIEDLRYLCPLEQAIWFPYCKSYTSPWAYQLAILFYHILPGYIMDIGMRLSGQKPRLIKIYDKIHRNVKKVSKFALTNWTFEMHNTEQLMHCMSEQDRKLFECDMNGVVWIDYFRVAMPGMRLYLGKEKPTKESIQIARKKLKRYATKIEICIQNGNFYLFLILIQISCISLYCKNYFLRYCRCYDLDGSTLYTWFLLVVLYTVYLNIGDGIIITVFNKVFLVIFLEVRLSSLSFNHFDDLTYIFLN